MDNHAEAIQNGRPMTNSQAIAATVAALRDAGRIEPVDEALVVMAAGIAAAVDADPGNASLWREYRAVELRLREIGGADDASDDFSRALAGLQTAVFDPEIV